MLRKLVKPKIEIENQVLQFDLGDVKRNYEIESITYPNPTKPRVRSQGLVIQFRKTGKISGEILTPRRDELYISLHINTYNETFKNIDLCFKKSLLLLKRDESENKDYTRSSGGHAVYA